MINIELAKTLSKNDDLFKSLDMFLGIKEIKESGKII
jgi:hypothetical protein